MKWNRKRRKLEYIRKKNGIRAGIFKTLFTHKVSQSVVDDVDAFIDVLDCNLIPHSIKKAEQYWRLKFEYVTFQMAYAGNDFMRDIVTIRLEFKYKPQ